MVTRAKTAVAAPAEPSGKPRIVLAEGLGRWLPAEGGAARPPRKRTDNPGGIALMRVYLQGVIDCHASGEAEGCGEIEAFAETVAKRFPLTGDLIANGEHRQRARELVTAYADAWVASGEEAYHRGRLDEREGC